MSRTERPETPLDPQLQRDLRALSEAGIEPRRDLWPGVERGISGPTRRRRPAWIYLAAAASLILAVVLVRQSLPRTIDEDLQALLVAPALQSARSEYLDERREVMREIVVRLGDYPPAVREEVVRGVQSIEQALAGIEASIADQTADKTTEERLEEFYALELRLLTVVRERLQGAGS